MTSSEFGYFLHFMGAEHLNGAGIVPIQCVLFQLEEHNLSGEGVLPLFVFVWETEIPFYVLYVILY